VAAESVASAQWRPSFRQLRPLHKLQVPSILIYIFITITNAGILGVVVVEGIYALRIWEWPSINQRPACQNKQNKGDSASPRVIQKVKSLQTFFAPPAEASWMGRTI